VLCYIEDNSNILGDNEPCGRMPVSTVWDRSMLTLPRSLGVAKIKPWGARRNAVRSSFGVNDSSNSMAATNPRRLGGEQRGNALQGQDRCVVAEARLQKIGTTRWGLPGRVSQITLLLRHGTRVAVASVPKAPSRSDKKNRKGHDMQDKRKCSERTEETAVRGKALPGPEGGIESLYLGQLGAPNRELKGTCIIYCGTNVHEEASPRVPQHVH
jgi:hypothetical protein